MIRARTFYILAPDEEVTISAYHEATSYQAEEATDRLQEPRITPEEVREEVHVSLMASIMVGAPV